MTGSTDRTATASRRVWLAVGVLVLTAAAWHLLARPLGAVLAPAIYATLIVQLLNPSVSWLQQHGVNRTLGTTATYVAVGLALYLLGSWTVPLIATQIAALVDQLPDLARDLQGNVNDLIVRAGGTWTVTLDLQAEETQQALLDWAQDGRNPVGAILGGVSNVAGTMLRFATVIILGPVVAFYLLLDLPRLGSLVRRWLPPAHRDEILSVATAASNAVSAYIRGQLILSAIVGLLTAVGCWAIGLPFFAVVGLIAGATNVIPLVGPFIGGAFGGLVALAVGDGTGQLVAVVIVVTIVQQIDNHLLSPAIVGRVVQLHPATVVLVLTAAATIGGIPAMVIAIPLTATTKLVGRHLLAEHTDIGRQAAAAPYASARTWRAGRRRRDDHPIDEDAAA